MFKLDINDNGELFLKVIPKEGDEISSYLIKRFLSTGSFKVFMYQNQLHIVPENKIEEWGKNLKYNL